MSGPDASDAGERAERDAATERGWRWLPAAMVALIAVVTASAVLLWLAWNRTPTDDSLEAGFARDMIVHHDQAVAMALLTRDRTTDPTVKTLATDMLLTQQNQIGQVLGWLANLQRLSGDAADAEFLRLMIAHHRGAIPMAEAALEGSGITPVRDLARSIVNSQQAEIAAMEELLRQNASAQDP